MIETDAKSIARTYCANNGITANVARIDAIAGALVAAHRYDPETGQHHVVDENGNPRVAVSASGEASDLSLGGYLAELTQGDRRGSAKPGSAAAPQPATRSGGIGADLKVGATSFRELLDTAQRVETAREVATWPNPWSARHANRTRQAIISNTDPALAAKFKALAGIQS